MGAVAYAVGDGYDRPMADDPVSDRHVEARVFAEELWGPARRGVLAALELVPEHRVPVVNASSCSPWIMVEQVPGAHYAVWRATGAVHQVDEESGAIVDPPVATP